MELGKRIKGYRNSLNWNQDDLAEKMFVSRQTISNWENDKSYPDIQSLLLLSNLFDISLDQLVKGDIEKMKTIINEKDVEKMKFYGKMLLICLFIIILAAGPLYLIAGPWGILPSAIVFVLYFYFAIKIGQIEKENDISTYKEIVTFLKGDTLDEVSKQREIGKRPYQTVFVSVVAALSSALVTCAVIFVFKRLMGM